MTRLRPGGFLLSKVHRTSGRLLGRMLKEHDLDQINPAQGRILFVLWQDDDLPTTELARRTGLGKSTMTSMLDRLEAAGYVERVSRPGDRRTIHVRRTLKDEAFRQAFLEVSEQMTAIWYKGFSEEERDQFDAFLARILANLEAEEGA